MWFRCSRNTNGSSSRRVLRRQRVRLISPAPQTNPGSIASTDGRKQHKITLVEATFRECIPSGQRNSSGGRIAELAEIENDPFDGYSKPLGRGHNDASIGLMGDHQLDVRRGEVVAFEDGLA